jgi:hypothetical protein
MKKSLLAALSLALVGATGAALPAHADAHAATGSVVAPPEQQPGGRIDPHFVGLSIEWSLIERYMGPAARPAFANLLANLGTGMLRIGGSSQDVMPFEKNSANTLRIITPDDLDAIRATLDEVNTREGHAAPGRPAWGVVLGTAMSPPSASRPFVSPEHARTFVQEGVLPAFAGDLDEVAGVELGNEPDLSYRADLDRYLTDLSTYAGPNVTGPLPVVAPNTSEDILPWQSIDDRSVPTRYFWDWPDILDTVAPQATTRAGAFGAWASDHFYPLARTCRNKPYRCPSIGALLSDEHLASLDYQVFEHARQAQARGLGYRLEETNTAAGRGADGVSNVAASAAYALDMMFHTACPQPPDEPGANLQCRTQGIGVNLHNAEVRAFFAPEEGNGYYNAVNYDPSPAMGSPTAAPDYYALLFFAHVAQGSSGLRPVPVTGLEAARVKAWRVQGEAGVRRLILLNKSDQPATVDVAVPTATATVDRMTPFDPTGAGNTLAATQGRIDGRQVAADGTWPGFNPTTETVRGTRLPINLAPGEAAAVTIH